ncbi:uncharacterized protein [Antedon mediterranea]|uniref:uncharacterized protein n=1 Tax=Antedon mediterranea TaxID=105859 RepID=UPI003AF43835
METFSNALTLIDQGVYMTSVDLKDAYYTVPIAYSDVKYLKFVWKGNLYAFGALPNGLSTGPRLFTKLLKPPLAYLRSRGHIVLIYIDDILAINKCRDKAKHTAREVCEILTSLGFIINYKKSVLQPTQTITFLGFEINSVTMTGVTLPQSKKEEIFNECHQVITSVQTTIRQVASLLGKLVAALPAVEYGKLHYRALEKGKIMSPRHNKGHYDRTMTINENGRADITWWQHNIYYVYKHISHGDPNLAFETDASGLGWGATDGTNHIGGRWCQNDLQNAFVNDSLNINYLELLAAFLGLKSLIKDVPVSNIHVQLKIDNTTAIAYINNMGGAKSNTCNHLAKMIWQWCTDHNIWLSAIHVPGKDNLIADNKSRHFDDEKEWMLNKDLFQKIKTLRNS